MIKDDTFTYPMLIGSMVGVSTITSEVLTVPTVRTEMVLEPKIMQETWRA